MNPVYHRTPKTATYKLLVVATGWPDRRGVPIRDEDTLLVDVGTRIHEIRLRRKLTQQGMAELLGVSAQYLRRVESGQENLTLRTLARVGATLGVDAGELLAAPKARPERKPGPAAAKASARKKK